MQNSLLLQLSDYLSKFGYIAEASEALALNKTADSTNNIVRLLHYPPFIAKYFIRKYGKYSFTIAKWAYQAYSVKIGDFKELGYKLESGLHAQFSKFNDTIIFRNFLIELLKLPEELQVKKIENFRDAEWFDIYFWINDKEYSISEHAKNWIEYIESDEFLDKIFIYLDHIEIINKYLNGSIDLNPYKKLDFVDAREKFKIYQKQHYPVVLETRGKKWINVGLRSEWVGEKMGNCGSAGIMQADMDCPEDRTILVLLNGLDPEVLLTYSKKSNVITGIEAKKSGYDIPIDDFEYIKELWLYLGQPKLSSTVKTLIKDYCMGVITDILDVLKDKSYATEDFIVKDSDGNILYATIYGRYRKAPPEANSWTKEDFMKYKEQSRGKPEWYI